MRIHINDGECALSSCAGTDFGRGLLIDAFSLILNLLSTVIINLFLDDISVTLNIFTLVIISLQIHSSSFIIIDPINPDVNVPIQPQPAQLTIKHHDCKEVQITKAIKI